MSSLSSLRQTLKGNHPSYEGTWYARVSTSAVEITDLVEVVIPAFSDVLSWGPCRWMPRGDLITYPQKGDECIVVFDERNDPWIVAWTPFI